MSALIQPDDMPADLADMVQVQLIARATRSVCVLDVYLHTHSVAREQTIQCFMSSFDDKGTHTNSIVHIKMSSKRACSRW